jgi:hypothetical protein
MDLASSLSVDLIFQKYNIITMVDHVEINFSLSVYAVNFFAFNN